VSETHGLVYRDVRGRWCTEGRRLLLLIVAQDGKQAVLAARLDVPIQRASDWCGGTRRPDWEHAVLLERFCGIACGNWGIAPLSFSPQTADRDRLLSSVIANAPERVADDEPTTVDRTGVDRRRGWRRFLFTKGAIR
jgi:hypothetical protein